MKASREYICKLAVLITFLMCVINMVAHPSWKDHAKDMYEAFGFEESKDLTDWMKFISSALIDGYNNEKIYAVAGAEKLGFYDYLKAKYPEFKCKHRVLFHWGYNSRPWNDQLQKKVESYHWSDAKIKSFQQELVNEQKRRNGNANEYTEKLFGFASGGKDAATARALISIAYDIHILGDYTPDNKDFDGLCNLSSVIGDLINNLRVLDNVNTKPLISQIQKASRANVSDPSKAQTILDILKKNLPEIIRNHPDSRISRKHANK